MDRWPVFFHDCSFTEAADDWANLGAEGQKKWMESGEKHLEWKLRKQWRFLWSRVEKSRQGRLGHFPGCGELRSVIGLERKSENVYYIRASGICEFCFLKFSGILDRLCFVRQRKTAKSIKMITNSHDEEFVDFKAKKKCHEGVQKDGVCLPEYSMAWQPPTAGERRRMLRQAQGPETKEHVSSDCRGRQTRLRKCHTAVMDKF